MSDRDTTYLHYLENRVRTNAKKSAAHLRDIADRIDRIADNAALDNVTTDVMHEVAWGVANANIDLIASSHADLVRARTTPAN